MPQHKAEENTASSGGCTACGKRFSSTRGLRVHQGRYCRVLAKRRRVRMEEGRGLATTEKLPLDAETVDSPAAMSALIGNPTCCGEKQDQEEVIILESAGLNERNTPNVAAEEWWEEVHVSRDWKTCLSRRAGVRPGLCREAFIASLRWEAYRRRGRQHLTRLVRKEAKKPQSGWLRYLRAPDVIDEHVRRAFNCPRHLIDLQAPDWIVNVLAGDRVEMAILTSVWGAIVEAATRAGSPKPPSFERISISTELWHGTAWRELEFQARRDHPETGGAVAPFVLFVDGTLVTRSLSKTPIVVEPAWIGEKARRSGCFCTIAALVPRLCFRRPVGMSLSVYTNTCRAASRWLSGTALAALCRQVCGVRKLSGRFVLVKALFCAVDSKEGHSLAHVFMAGKAACPCRLCFVPFEQCNYFGPDSWANAHKTDDAIAVAARPALCLEEVHAEASQHPGNPVVNNADFFACPGPAAVPYDLLHTVCEHSKVAVTWTYDLLRFRGQRGDTGALEELEKAMRDLRPLYPVPSGWMRWRRLPFGGLSDLSRGMVGCDITDAFLDSRDRPSIALQVFIAFLVRPRLCANTHSQEFKKRIQSDRALVMSALWGAVGLHLDSHRRGWTNELRTALRGSVQISVAHLTDLWARRQEVRGKWKGILSKIKFHAALHLPESILRFGTALACDVEKFEGNHVPFKSAWRRVAHNRQKEESASSLSVLGKISEEIGLAWITEKDKENEAIEDPAKATYSNPQPPSGVVVVVNRFVAGRMRHVRVDTLLACLPAGSDAHDKLVDLLSSECGYDSEITKGKVCLLRCITLVWPDCTRATVHAASDPDACWQKCDSNCNQESNGNDREDNDNNAGGNGNDVKPDGCRSCVSVLGIAGTTQPFDIHFLVQIKDETYALGFYLVPISSSPASPPPTISKHEIPDGWQEVVYERGVGNRRGAIRARLFAVPMTAIDGPACLIDLQRRGEGRVGRLPALEYHGLYIPRRFFLRGTSDLVTQPCATWLPFDREQILPPGELYRNLVQRNNASSDYSMDEDNDQEEDNDWGRCANNEKKREEREKGEEEEEEKEEEEEEEEEEGKKQKEGQESSDKSSQGNEEASVDSGPCYNASVLGGVHWASAPEFLKIVVPRTTKALALIGWRAKMPGPSFPWPATIIGCAHAPKGQQERSRLVAELANGIRMWAENFPGGLDAFSWHPRWLYAENATVVAFFNYEDEGRIDVPVRGIVSFHRFRASRGSCHQGLQPTFSVRWDDGTTTTEVGFDWVSAHATSPLIQNFSQERAF